LRWCLTDDGVKKGKYGSLAPSIAMVLTDDGVKKGGKIRPLAPAQPLRLTDGSVEREQNSNEMQAQDGMLRLPQ
jgi:hypothetical protein